MLGSVRNSDCLDCRLYCLVDFIKTPIRKSLPLWSGSEKAILSQLRHFRVYKINAVITNYTDRSTN